MVSKKLLYDTISLSHGKHARARTFVCACASLFVWCSFKMAHLCGCIVCEHTHTHPKTYKHEQMRLWNEKNKLCLRHRCCRHTPHRWSPNSHQIDARKRLYTDNKNGNLHNKQFVRFGIVHQSNRAALKQHKRHVKEKSESGRTEKKNKANSTPSKQ